MKTIPAPLQTHYDQTVTTYCHLHKVECVGTFAGTVLGFTDLDIDVVYDDGDGALTYVSANGFVAKAFQRSADLRVNSSEVDGVIAAGAVTEARIRAGLFNFAKLTTYRINYTDLTAGRHEVVDYGRAGQTIFDRLQWTTEFRSLSQLLLQPIGQPYSQTCIAKFGSSGVRWACNKALVWTPGTVTAVGADVLRQFTDSAAVEADGFYDIGVVRWTNGANQGVEMEINTFVAGAFDLALDLPAAIQVGDEYERRQDCDKTFAMCRDVHANTDNFRGQNKAPIDGSGMIPGAEIQRA